MVNVVVDFKATPMNLAFAPKPSHLKHASCSFTNLSLGTAVTQYIIMMLKYINYTESSWAQAITLALADLLG